MRCWSMAHASMDHFQSFLAGTVLKRVQFQQGRFNNIIFILAGFQSNGNYITLLMF